MKNYLYLILAVTLTACSSTSTKNKNYDAYVKAVSSEPPMVLNDREIRKEAQQGIDQLITDGKSYTKHAKLVEQLKRTSCKLDLKSVGVETMTPSEIYQQRIKSVVLVGVIHHCNSKTCKRNHYNPASGVIIHEDGVVLTNYHVVDSKVKNVMGMAVTTVDGKVYFVDEVLAASKGDDVAILKLKDAKGLTAAPVFKDEPVGNPVTLITHPIGLFFTLTQGYISRYGKDHQGQFRMHITADYAKGSSGGPIFNNRGDVVGLVSSTRSITYTNVPLAIDTENESLTTKREGNKLAEFRGQKLFLGMNHQMTLKISVPSRSVMKLIKDASL